MAKKNLSATEHKVARYISQQGLMEKEGKYIVALSGGADSVALLSILSALGKNVSAAHCNFHLRGEESDRDEQFCVDLCQRWGIHLHRIHFDTLTYAQQHKVSIEMAARDLRYRYFAQLAHDIEADGICVAHHRDDNVETLLLNLLRGSGVEGLAAIAPKNGNIIRPLLCISRQEILDYLREKGQDYVTDSTNLEDDALRNKIRHHVIPLLQQLNPAAVENMAQTAKYMRQAKSMLDDMMQTEGFTDMMQTGGFDNMMTSGNVVDDPNTAEPRCNVIRINRQKVESAASPEYVLHHELGKYGFHGDVIDQMCQAMNCGRSMGCEDQGVGSKDQGVGKVWKNNDYMVAIDRDCLLVTPHHFMEALQREPDFHIPEEGNYTRTDAKIRIKTYPRTADFAPSKVSHCITLDAAKVSFPLTYRLAQEGDRFTPFGMKGSKLVSDYLTDRKRDYLQKASQHVMTDSKGEIIWLTGERSSEKCKIDENTKNILEISIEKKE